MINKLLTLSLSVVISLVLSGCSSSQLYKGDELPPEEVAFIRVEGKEFYDFRYENRDNLNPRQSVILKGKDGTHEWTSREWKSILPGKYEITVDIGYSRGEVTSIAINNTTLRQETKIPGGVSCTIEFEAKKGKSYVVDFYNMIFSPFKSGKNGKGIYLFKRYAYAYGSGDDLVLYRYSYRININEYITGAEIENGKLIGSCKDKTEN